MSFESHLKLSFIKVWSDVHAPSLIVIFCRYFYQCYNASRYTEPPIAASQSYDDLTERIEQALRISSSGMSTHCNLDQSLVM